MSIDLQLRQLERENQSLRLRLQEAEDALKAIRSGEVDTLIVTGPKGDQLFTLKGADYTYRVLIEEMQEGAIILTQDGIVLYANNFLEKILNKPLENIIGSHIERLIHSPDIPSIRSALRCSETENISVESRLETRDGRQVPVYLSITRISLDEVPTFCITVTDLTDQKRYERILAEERLSRSIIEQSADMILVCDDQGKVIRASQAADNMAGRSCLGQRFDELFHLYINLNNASLNAPEPCLAPFSIESVFEGRIYHSHETFTENNGVGTNYLLLSAALLKDGLNNTIGAILNLTDITGEKAVEAQLLEAKKELLHINGTLEQQIAHEVQKNMAHERLLIQQSRMAAMGEMINNIAHQWRQPLNTLGLLLFNIRDAYQFNELNAGVLDQMIGTGNQLIQKMSTTISDFSNYLRPNKKICIFSALEQIREAMIMVESSFKKNDISIHIHAPNDLKLQGFPNEYSQVFVNLLSNAQEAILKLNPADSDKAVRIVLTEIGGQGCVSVCDNGSGIPADILERIFEPYFSTKEKGSGIGLYMSKMIIEQNMNGSITAANIEGGAEFRVCVPLAEV